jgi:hypothetical protein
VTDAHARSPDLSLPETTFLPLEDPGPGTGTTPALRVTPPEHPSPILQTENRTVTFAAQKDGSLRVTDGSWLGAAPAQPSPRLYGLRSGGVGCTKIW